MVQNADFSQAQPYEAVSHHLTTKFGRTSRALARHVPKHYLRVHLLVNSHLALECFYRQGYLVQNLHPSTPMYLRSLKSVVLSLGKYLAWGCS